MGGQKAHVIFQPFGFLGSNLIILRRKARYVWNVSQVVPVVELEVVSCEPAGERKERAAQSPRYCVGNSPRPLREGNVELGDGRTAVALHKFAVGRMPDPIEREQVQELKFGCKQLVAYFDPEF